MKHVFETSINFKSDLLEVRGIGEDFAEQQTKDYLIGDGKSILAMFFTCFVFLMLYT